MMVDQPVQAAWIAGAIEGFFRAWNVAADGCRSTDALVGLELRSRPMTTV